MNDVIFRYKNGRIIPIKVNKDKTTNEYMNDKLRNIKKRPEIYKAGDGTWMMELPNDEVTDYGTNWIQGRTKKDVLEEYDLMQERRKSEDKTYYHTSNHDFNEFNNEMPRKAILGGQYGYGHYFFDDKEISDGYGAYATYQYETKINVDNWFNATDKTFDKEIRNMGYNFEKDDIADFLQKKGYGGAKIEHTNSKGEKWYEYVVYDGKNIKIKNKKKQN